MKMESWRLATVVICVAILLSGGASALLGMGTVGYPSGYEGVKASFIGIDWKYGDQSGRWTDVGLDFYFDADDPSYYAPNLVGEMTNAFVPEESIRPSWISPELHDFGYLQNPVDTDTWNLPNPDDPDEIIAYEVSEWILRMYVSITCEWDEAFSLYPKGESEKWNKRYTDTKIWIELDLVSPPMFAGADDVYFGIAKVMSAGREFGKYGTSDYGDEYSPSAWISVTPESQKSTRYLYYEAFGQVSQSPASPFMYKGREINPDVFVDAVYFYVALNNFGTQSWTEWDLTVDTVGDAVTWAFDIHVFVVGEWKVQDVTDLPDEYGRDPKFYEEDTFLDHLARILSDPRGQFWLLMGIGAIIVLFLVVFAPSVLIMLLSLFRGRGKE